MKSRKNYFEEIKNHRIEDKFIEHLIRLLFFTVVIGIGSIYQRIKASLFHVKNFFLNRRMSDILAKYRRYKESAHSLMERTVHNKRLHSQIHEAINTHFTEYERRIVFGLKESRDSIVSSSRRLISSVKGYTKKMSARYFEHIPEITLTKKVSSSLISIQLLRKTGRNAADRNCRDFTETVHYLNSVARGYKKYMAGKFEKFYTEDFRKKISDSSMKMKTVRKNIDKISDTLRRAEQRRVRYRFSNSSH